MIVAHYNPDEFFGEHSPRAGRVFEDAIPEYDVHFIPKPINIGDYERRGAKRIEVFDRSYDPELHRPVMLSLEEQEAYGCEIGFIGTYAPHREEVLADLIRKGYPVRVYGNGWKTHGNEWNVIKSAWKGPGQYNQEYVKAICGMEIALHFLRRENRDEQDSRSFEIPACGTFMLAERSHAHERLFKESEEAEYFDDMTELIDKLDFYRSHPSEREMIARRGRVRCENSPYSHDDRLTEFLSIMESCRQEMKSV